MNISSLKPYIPPLEGRTKSGQLLLDFNERTTPASPLVDAALQEFVTTGAYRRYPSYSALYPLLAAYTGARESQLAITNGSDRGIELIIQTLVAPGEEIIIPAPTFVLFEQYATIREAKIIQPLYERDLSFPLQGVLDAISEKTKLIIVCNPNNPTGTLASQEAIETLCIKAQEVGAFVLVDEAYGEFSGVTCSALLSRYKHLIITRTFSKAFGLAALRIGYLMANEQIIEVIKKVQSPYEVNMAAVIAAQAALQDIAYMTDYCREVMQEAKPLTEDFFRSKEIAFYPSYGNFILFKPENPTLIFNKLRERGMLIRPRTGCRIEDTLRVSIGTVSNMNQFIYEYSTINN
ncbi:histidinol-phosphate transaminase [Candidatus Gracilibacteria bacterium]|nr:histidinol-phosphate transaminase [Candidatus Gracilibacteria bacterium]